MPKWCDVSLVKFSELLRYVIFQYISALYIYKYILYIHNILTCFFPQKWFTPKHWWRTLEDLAVLHDWTPPLLGTHVMARFASRFSLILWMVLLLSCQREATAQTAGWENPDSWAQPIEPTAQSRRWHGRSRDHFAVRVGFWLVNHPYTGKSVDLIWSSTCEPWLLAGTCWTCRVNIIQLWRIDHLQSIYLWVY